MLATQQPQEVKAFGKEPGEIRQSSLHLGAVHLWIDDSQIAGRRSRAEVSKQAKAELVLGALHETCDPSLDERSPDVSAVIEDRDGARVDLEDGFQVRLNSPTGV